MLAHYNLPVSATADALFGDASDISSDSDVEPPPKADENDDASQDKVSGKNSGYWLATKQHS